MSKDGFTDVLKGRVNLLGGAGSKFKFAALLVLTLGLLATVVAVQQEQELRRKAAAGEVDLTLIASKAEVVPGEEFQVDVVMNTNDLSVSAMEIHIEFDGAYFDVVDISKTTVLPVVLPPGPQIDNVSGTASIILGSNPGDPKAGVETVATLRMVGLMETPSYAEEIRFGGGTQVAAIDHMSNVAGNLSSTNVKVRSSVAPSPSPTAVLTGDPPPPTSQPTPEPTVEPTLIPTIKPSPTPTSIPEPTNTPAPGDTTLSFNIRFQGISNKGPDKTVRVELRHLDMIIGGEVIVIPDSGGSYFGETFSLSPRTYEVLIKEPAHLAKNFGEITLVEGYNFKDFRSPPLMAGDFNDDNVLNVIDLGMFLAQYTQLVVPVDGGNAIYDVNGDGEINVIDIAIVLTNYTELSIYGEDLFIYGEY